MIPARSESAGVPTCQADGELAAEFMPRVESAIAGAAALQRCEWSRRVGTRIDAESWDADPRMALAGAGLGHADLNSPR